MSYKRYDTKAKVINSLIRSKMTRKKKYEKPSFEVVKLQTSVVMLAGSNTNGEKQDYGDQEDLGTWEEEGGTNAGKRDYGNLNNLGTWGED